MNAQLAVKRDRSPQGVAPCTYRMSRGRELNGSLTVTIDSSQLLLVRRAILKSGCDPVGIVKAAPLAGGTRVRLLIAMRPEFVQRVMDSIVRTVGAGVAASAAR